MKRTSERKLEDVADEVGVVSRATEGCRLGGLRRVHSVLDLLPGLTLIHNTRMRIVHHKSSIRQRSSFIWSDDHKIQALLVNEVCDVDLVVRFLQAR